MKTLAGLLRARQGDIVLRRQHPRALPAKRVHAGISYVPQEYNVFRNLTVLENLKIAREFMSGGRAKGPVVSRSWWRSSPSCRRASRRSPAISPRPAQMLAFACASR